MANQASNDFNPQQVEQDLIIIQDRKTIGTYNSKKSLTSTLSKEEFKILVTEGMSTDEMLLCNKLEKSPIFSFDSLTIIVDQPTQISGSLFSSGYTTYNIKCKELGSEVKRRYKDFEWLYQAFRSMFPTSVVRTVYMNLLKKDSPVAGESLK